MSSARIVRHRDEGIPDLCGGACYLSAYVHIVEFGRPVEVGGLAIRPRDLLHGDRHGVLTIPQELALGLPAVAQVIREKKQQLIDLSRRPEANCDELIGRLRDLLDFRRNSIRQGVNQAKS